MSNERNHQVLIVKLNAIKKRLKLSQCIDIIYIMSELILFLKFLIKALLTTK